MSLLLDDVFDECFAAKQREVVAEASADEDLSSWLLPRYSLALRRMRAARATAEQHQAALDLFAAVCGRLGRASLPAAPETVAMYLMSMFDMGRPVKTVRAMCDAIAWAHRDAGLANPCDTDICDCVFETAELAKKEKRRNGHGH